MRRNALSVLAVVVVLLVAGCTSPLSASLPPPASPPYSGHTQSVDQAIIGSDAANTWAYVYGCASISNTKVWASIDEWPAIGAVNPVDEVYVWVDLGYVSRITSNNPTGLGDATFTRDQPTGDVATVAAGQCFTVVVDAQIQTQFAQAGTVNFTLNW
jgi:hypothetical protein